MTEARNARAQRMAGFLVGSPPHINETQRLLHLSDLSPHMLCSCRLCLCPAQLVSLTALGSDQYYLKAVGAAPQAECNLSDAISHARSFASFITSWAVLGRLVQNFVTHSLLLVAMPGATSSVLAPSSDALCY